MNGEYLVCIHSGISSSHKWKWNTDICNNIQGIGYDCVEGSKSGTEIQMSHDFTGVSPKNAGVGPVREQSRQNRLPPCLMTWVPSPECIAEGENQLLKAVLWILCSSIFQIKIIHGNKTYIISVIMNVSYNKKITCIQEWMHRRMSLKQLEGTLGDIWVIVINIHNHMLEPSEVVFVYHSCTLVKSCTRVCTSPKLLLSKVMEFSCVNKDVVEKK